MKDVVSCGKGRWLLYTGPKTPTTNYL